MQLPPYLLSADSKGRHKVSQADGLSSHHTHQRRLSVSFSHLNLKKIPRSGNHSCRIILSKKKKKNREQKSSLWKGEREKKTLLIINV